MHPAIVIIPSRLNSTRLPQKALALIGNHTLIEHVWHNAMQSQLPVVVATDHKDIAHAITQHGGNTIMTSDRHTSGTDRVHEASQHLFCSERAMISEDAIIINVQGDIPFVPHMVLNMLVEGLNNHSDIDVMTAVYPIKTPQEAAPPSVVTVAIEWQKPSSVSCATQTAHHHPQIVGRAHYFSRAHLAATPYVTHHEEIQPAAWGHVGLYAYRSKALARFSQANVSYIEQAEQLEQLRAYTCGLRIGVVAIKESMLSVDVPQDLESARLIYQQQPYAIGAKI